MAIGDFALLLRPDARQVFANTVSLLKQIDWSAEEGKPKPLCLVCEEVDFSGPLVMAQVLPADESQPTFRIWIPHFFVMLAFDFEGARSVGFLQAAK